jgi:hypothetical protein
MLETGRTARPGIDRELSKPMPGGASPSTTAAKMANSISSANAIHKTYQPVDFGKRQTGVTRTNEAEKSKLRSETSLNFSIFAAPSY